MKRIEVGSQKPNFIGCWDIDNKNLCNEKGTGFIRFSSESYKII